MEEEPSSLRHHVNCSYNFATFYCFIFCRCASFPLIPPECKLQRDPTDVCCFVPVCNYTQTPAPVPGLLSPSPGVPTLPPCMTPVCPLRVILAKKHLKMTVGLRSLLTKSSKKKKSKQTFYLYILLTLVTKTDGTL